MITVFKTFVIIAMTVDMGNVLAKQTNKKTKKLKTNSFLVAITLRMKLYKLYMNSMFSHFEEWLREMGYYVMVHSYPRETVS